jgi:uncharacterized membrane protein YkoI
MKMLKTLGIPAVVLSFAVAVPAWADDKALPADQVVAAIQAAVAAYPGRVKDVEVKEENWRLIVEVEIVGEGNRKREIKVDASTRQVVTK